MSEEKISLYSVADLKNSTDDAIQAYMNSLKFKQSHHLTDFRLALGYVVISISATTFYWDYKYGFEKTKTYVGFAVVIYTILNSILTIWITFFEKKTIYIAKNSQGDEIHLSSKSDKYVPVYILKVTTYLNSQSKKANTVTLERSFSHWFNQGGYLVPLYLQQMLASNVPMIGAADPQRVVESLAKKGGLLDNEVHENSESSGEKATFLAESSGVDVTHNSIINVSKPSKKRAPKA